MLLGYVEGATNDFDSLFDGKTMAVGNSVSEKGRLFPCMAKLFSPFIV